MLRITRFLLRHTDYKIPRSETRRSLLNPSQMSSDAYHWFIYVCQAPNKTLAFKQDIKELRKRGATTETMTRPNQIWQ